METKPPDGRASVPEDLHGQVLRSWMDQASDGIFLADADGRYVDANRRACEMLGRSREELVGLHLREVIDPDDLRARPLALASIGVGHASLTERRLRRADGGTILVEISATRLEDGRYLSIVRDVTARREAELAARRAEESFRALLDVLPDAVVVHHEGRVVYANATAARYGGFERPEEVVGTPVIELVHPDDRALVRDRIRAMMTTGVSAGLQRERFVRRDGSTFAADVVALPLRFDGRPSLLAVVHDVTERERLQAQLVQSERLASVGLLAAGVAHEINNPLAYVMLNLERVSDGLRAAGGDPSLARSVSDALDGARRVQRIVRDLRTFARSLRDEVAPVDVNAAVEAALQLAAHELRLRAHVSSDLEAVPHVGANEARLTQVFLNLLVNAAHAIPEGHAERNEVRVTSRATGAEVRVEVRDTGAGIAPEHRARLFDPFFTTKAPGSGTGLGLSICHSIVTSFGGRIEVESAPGRGSAFTVVLPVSHAPAPAEPERPSLEHVAPRGPARRRLLLVEDERHMRTVLKTLLSDRYEVTATATGREAQKVLAEGAPWDLVLCDLLMPEVTGMDLYEWIERERPELTQRVVFMTGGAFTERARSVLRRAPGRYIEKPFELDALTALLERVASAPGPRAPGG